PSLRQCASFSPFSMPSSGTINHGKTLDEQDSRSPRRGEEEQAAVFAVSAMSFDFHSGHPTPELRSDPPPQGEG
ncbi:hypothetical protein, partial [Pararhizobium sp. DWP3-4]|uniref:hypothetical protein n=1 Tax=Pararhizobium sp. DWP3-4 TaxID=2804565 RepID=UPI003CFA4154